MESYNDGAEYAAPAGEVFDETAANYYQHQFDQQYDQQQYNQQYDQQQNYYNQFDGHEIPPAEELGAGYVASEQIDATKDEGEWVQYYDEESGYPYVYNTVTGETKWIDAETSNNLLVTLWEKYYDEQGYEFYYNPTTGESRWELPENAVLGTEQQQEQFETYQYNEEEHFADAEPAASSFADGVTSGVSGGGSGSVPGIGEGLTQVSITSVSGKSVSLVAMHTLTKKASMESIKSKSSFRRLEKKHSAQSLGLKSGSSFIISKSVSIDESLKPTSPNKRMKGSKSGFQLLRKNATVLRKRNDEIDGSVWLEYETASDGAIFYMKDGSDIGQWSKPALFDAEELDSPSHVSVEQLDGSSLDKVLGSGITPFSPDAGGGPPSFGALALGSSASTGADSASSPHPASPLQNIPSTWNAMGSMLGTVAASEVVDATVGSDSIGESLPQRTNEIHDKVLAGTATSAPPVVNYIHPIAEEEGMDDAAALEHPVAHKDMKPNYTMSNKTQASAATAQSSITMSGRENDVPSTGGESSTSTPKSNNGGVGNTLDAGGSLNDQQATDTEPIFGIANQAETEAPVQLERKSLFGSFINDVYQTSAARDKETAEKRGKQELAADALFGSDDGSNGSREAAEDINNASALNLTDSRPDEYEAVETINNASPLDEPSAHVSVEHTNTVDSPKELGKFDTNELSSLTIDESSNLSRLPISSPVAFKQGKALEPIPERISLRENSMTETESLARSSIDGGGLSRSNSISQMALNVVSGALSEGIATSSRRNFSATNDPTVDLPAPVEEVLDNDQLQAEEVTKEEDDDQRQGEEGLEDGENDESEEDAFAAIMRAAAAEARAEAKATAEQVEKEALQRVSSMHSLEMVATHTSEEQSAVPTSGELVVSTTPTLAEEVKTLPRSPTDDINKILMAAMGGTEATSVKQHEVTVTFDPFADNTMENVLAASRPAIERNDDDCFSQTSTATDIEGVQQEQKPLKESVLSRTASPPGEEINNEPIPQNFVESRDQTKKQEIEQEEEGEWVQYLDEETGMPYLYNDVLGIAKWLDMDADGGGDIMVAVWEKYYDEKGYPYYYNKETGMASWELPAGAKLGDARIQSQQSLDLDNLGVANIDDANDVQNLDEDSQEIIHSPIIRQASTKDSSIFSPAGLVPSSSMISLRSVNKLSNSPAKTQSLEKKLSAAQIGIKSGSSFIVAKQNAVNDVLKPATPYLHQSNAGSEESSNNIRSGFQILRDEGAAVLRSAWDETNAVMWLEYQVPNNGPKFYMQEDTDEGQWTQPIAFAGDATNAENVDARDAPIGSDTNAPASIERGSIPTADTSPSQSGTVSLHHYDPGVWVLYADPDSGLNYLYNSSTGESRWVDVEWQKLYDENGYEYYFNNVTGESRWDLPATAVVSQDGEQHRRKLEHRVKSGESLPAIAAVDEQKRPSARAQRGSVLRTSASGFELMRNAGATVLRTAYDVEEDAVWMEFQVVNGDGAIFYMKQGSNLGQWNRPRCFDDAEDVEEDLSLSMEGPKAGEPAVLPTSTATDGSKGSKMSSGRSVRSKKSKKSSRSNGSRSKHAGTSSSGDERLSPRLNQSSMSSATMSQGEGGTAPEKAQISATSFPQSPEYHSAVGVAYDSSDRINVGATLEDTPVMPQHSPSTEKKHLLTMSSKLRPNEISFGSAAIERDLMLMSLNSRSQMNLTKQQSNFSFQSDYLSPSLHEMFDSLLQNPRSRKSSAATGDDVTSAHVAAAIAASAPNLEHSNRGASFRSDGGATNGSGRKYAWDTHDSRAAGVHLQPLMEVASPAMSRPVTGKSSPGRFSNEPSPHGAFLTALQHQGANVEFGEPVPSESKDRANLHVFTEEDAELVHKYAPPEGFSASELEEEMKQAQRIEGLLRTAAKGDLYEDESQQFLRRLQIIGDGCPIAGTMRPPPPATKGDPSLQSRTSRRIIESMLNLLERLEASNLEHELNELYLLEMALWQRSRLVQPPSLSHDHLVYSGLPSYCLCPTSVSFEEVKDRLLQIAESEEWLLCRDPFFNQGQLYYVHKITSQMQCAEPFDVTMKRHRESFVQENWFEFAVNTTESQHALRNAGVDLLRDQYGGLLFYDSTRDTYNSNGSIGISAAGKGLSTIYSPGAQQTVASTWGSPVRDAGNKSDVYRADILYSHRRRQMNHRSSPRKVHGSALATLGATAIVVSQGAQSDNLWAHFDLSAALAAEEEVAEMNAIDIDDFMLTGLNSESRVSSNKPGSSSLMDEKLHNGISRHGTDFRDRGYSNDTLFNGILSPNQNFNSFLRSAFSTHITDFVTVEAEETLRRFSSPTRRNPYQSFQFEESLLCGIAYKDYQRNVRSLGEDPENPVVLLEVMRLLLYQGLGKPAMASLKRALEVIENSSELQISTHTKVMSHLLTYFIGRKYFGYFERSYDIIAYAKMFPESPAILAHCGVLLQQACMDEAAEALFVGALMINPNYDVALVHYARLLCASPQRNYRSALRYLSRVDVKSDFSVVAALEAARIQELMDRNEVCTLRVAYKTCLPITGALPADGDRNVSCAMYSISHLSFFSDGEPNKARDFLERALKCDADNPMAHLLTASIAAVYVPPTETAAILLGSNESVENLSISHLYSQLSGCKAFHMSVEQIDAKFRTGTLLLYRHKYLWIAMLSYADFILCVKGDAERALIYYHQAVNISFTESVWPSIALAQCLQYTFGDEVSAGHVLLRSLRQQHSGIQIDSLASFQPTHGIEERMSLNTSGMKTTAAKGSSSFVTSCASPNDELCAIYTAIAYYLMDKHFWIEAMRYASASLSIRENYTPALRCVALICAQHKETKSMASKYFNAAIGGSSTLEQNEASNPYVMRAFSVLRAIEGYQSTAIKLMESSLQCGGAKCPLSSRILGQMLYLYCNDTNKALEYFSASFVLSRQVDVDCLRMKAQVLMDCGRLKEARVCLQKALYVLPYNSMNLACLAHCVAMLYPLQGPGVKGKATSTRKSTSAYYNAKLRGLSSFEDLIHSRDAEELFEAALTVDLHRIVGANQKLPAADYANYVPTTSENIFKAAATRGSNSDENVLSNFATDIDADSLSAIERSNVCIYTYYWYGMFELRKNTRDSISKAHTLLTLAASKDGSMHDLQARALYALGTLAEQSGDYNAAEKLYQNAVERVDFDDGVDPIALLRIGALVEDSLANVKRLIKLCSKAAGIKKRTAKGRKTIKKATALLESSGTLSSFHPQRPVTDKTQSFVNSLSSLLHHALEEDNGETFGRAEEEKKNSEAMNDAIAELQKRRLIHQRVQEVVVLKKHRYSKYIKRICAPERSVQHLCLESDWLLHALRSFSKCDDWSWLLRSLPNFVDSRAGRFFSSRSESGGEKVEKTTASSSIGVSGAASRRPASAPAGSASGTRKSLNRPNL